MPQQRDTVRSISPPWLSTGAAEKVLYNYGLSCDMLLEKLNQAVRAHMPGAGTNTALVFIGDDRRITQGPFEADDDYAARLTGAFESWQRAGSRRAVLSQVVSYLSSPLLAPAARVPVAAIVGGAWPSWDLYYSGDDPKQAPNHVLPAPANWAWDDAVQWWRAWLVLYFTAQFTGLLGAHASITVASGGMVTLTGLSGLGSTNVGNTLSVSGAASGGNNGVWRIEQVFSGTSCLVSNPTAVAPDANNGSITWSIDSYPTVGPGAAKGAPGHVKGDLTRSKGLSCPPGVIAGVREILSEWKRASSYYPEILVAFDGGTGLAGNTFSPYSSPGVGNPDVHFAHFGKYVAGASVPARVIGGPLGKFDCYCGDIT